MDICHYWFSRKSNFWNILQKIIAIKEIKKSLKLKKKNKKKTGSKLHVKCKT